LIQRIRKQEKRDCYGIQNTPSVRRRDKRGGKDGGNLRTNERAEFARKKKKGEARSQTCGEMDKQTKEKEGGSVEKEGGTRIVCTWDMKE